MRGISDEGFDDVHEGLDSLDFCGGRHAVAEIEYVPGTLPHGAREPERLPDHDAWAGGEEHRVEGRGRT